MCSCSVRLQDSLIINIPGRKQPMSQIFHRDINHKKITCKLLLLIWCCYACPVTPRHAWTYQGVNLIGLRVIQNQRLIVFYGESVFLSFVVSYKF